MAAIHLTLACGTYDINRALIDGRVKPNGIDLTVVTAPSPERHRRMTRFGEFDACELSMATYLVLAGRSDNPLLAIPAFPHRRFRHSYVYVNTAAGIREPRDLEGRRVGLRSWQTTAGLWMRGILQDEHGVDLRSITWVAQDEEDIPFTPSSGLTLQRAPAGSTVTGMLESGDLDALIYPETPIAILSGDPRVRRLFPDSKAQEIAYAERTGFFPIMHTVVVRRAILDSEPWVAVNLLQAFEASKRLAFAEMADPRSISLAWVQETIDEQRRVLGDDPWCYSFEPNRSAIETMIRWAHEQDMLTQPMSATDLFASSTIDALPQYV